MRVNFSKRHIVWIAVAILPISVIAYCLKRYGINVPSRDQWPEVSFYIHAQTNNLTWQDIYGFHNEHRMPVSKAVLALLAVPGWNTVREMWASLFIQVAAFVPLYFLFRRTAAEYAWPLLAATSVVMFSPNQAENWLWGWQLAWFLSMAFTLSAISILCLCENRVVALVISHAFALASAFSIAGGQAAFVAVFVTLVLRKQDYGKAWIIPLASIPLVITMYFHGYNAAENVYHSPPPLLQVLPRVIVYTCGYIGKPLAPTIPSAQPWVGFAGCILLAVATLAVLRDKKLQQRNLLDIAPFVGIACFAAVNAAVTSYGRISVFEDPKIGIESRYILFANLFWIGLMGVSLTVKLRASSSSLQKLSLAIPFFITAAVVTTYPFGVTTFHRMNAVQVEGLFGVLHFQEEGMRRHYRVLYHDADVVYKGAGALKAAGLYPFSPTGSR